MTWDEANEKIDAAITLLQEGKWFLEDIQSRGGMAPRSLVIDSSGQPIFEWQMAFDEITSFRGILGDIATGQPTHAPKTIAEYLERFKTLQSFTVSADESPQ